MSALRVQDEKNAPMVSSGHFETSCLSADAGHRSEAEHLHDFQHGTELGIAGNGKGAVQIDAGEAGLTGDLGHAVGAGDVTERFADQRAVPGIFFISRLEHLFKLFAGLVVFRCAELVEFHFFGLLASRWECPASGAA